ncbi:L-ornithine N5-oxygenase [Streptoalloteichus tenebrarius]|uniref:L-lysine N6-monooxygenase MbtG n=1 Tax=Streptoalloteichus tenebrarius (strain ATCC 17920 / DSM 40477 / JCM 4838 / CBS 697.72 / NBRC 16177 / NCIMB 11028 / NRRL B-12390 / A12253. 1 / ISP 5477) TaxID=1933 RepID=A0ABT1HQK1_STRSD|nr:SidA/IucD/PvdA family monooxygenase [Streptoalloteichus tenebrarius]MCP2257796.1 L-ornithine N5-oxygenase [Streptoalloteichus tenebrarius]BFE99843.1 SidA/IucD/PvdA family monooxygenase [Streptoalloteichus tenebrarius]
MTSGAGEGPTGGEGDGVVRDVVGVGFGPSNLALAVAVEEHARRSPAGERVDAVFLERQPRFGWHRGMLLDDATMQVSFLKDLVTMRDPTSSYSFLCYLRERGRLVDFVNHKTLFPLRTEFHDYLEWAAARVGHLARYDSEVVAVEPVTDHDGEVVAVDVAVRRGDGGADRYRARNLVLAPGLRPHLPADVRLSERIWHNHDLLSRIEGLTGTPRRFVVVGAGQSAAETTEYLHRTFPSAEVCAVFARYGYSPADDSSFANRIFDPEAVDTFYAAPEPVKRMLVDYHRNTNYSVVDVDLIDDLYRRTYAEKVSGRERLRILHASRLVDVRETGDGVRAAVEFLPTGRRTPLDADVVVYATGYRPSDPLELLGPLAGLCRRDEAGRPRIGRDYRVVTDDAVRAGIYVQGATEHTHGITSTLLSTTAVRVGEILNSIIDHGRRPTAAPRPAYALSGNPA